MKRELLLVSLLFFIDCIYAYELKQNGIIYSVKGMCASVIALDTLYFRDYNGTLRIPSCVKSEGKVLKVNKISYVTPSQSIKKVIIPESVSIISPYAFDKNNIESVILKSDTLMIMDYAFVLCVNLREVIATGVVTVIGKGAFSGCKSLTKIKIKQAKKIDVLVFYGCDSLEEFRIPYGVDTFNLINICHCMSLKYLYLPKTLKKLEMTSCNYGLKKIFVSRGNRYYKYQDGVLFSKDGSCLLNLCTSK